MDLTKLYGILSRVAKPSQYLGNEINVIQKDFDAASVRVCLIFPDKYEMGMSHVGLKILYDQLNKIPDVVCERAFAPELDLEAELRQENLPLFSLESKRALKDFDIVGFSLTYELTYTNMVNIIDLGGIPIWQKDRTDGHPLVIAGGGCTMNAEPFADFVDAAVLGDGEEVILDLVEAVRNFKTRRGGVSPPLISHNEGRGDPAPTRIDLLHALSSIEGVYVPSFFEPEYNQDLTLKRMRPLKPGYERVNKRVVENIDKAPFPTRLLVPSVKLIHDRIGIEIQRGCNRACRFCQAGYIDRPVRQRSPESILKIAEESLKETGIDQISLLSLSAADYACLVDVLKELNGRYADEKIAISVPATRTEKLTPELIEQIKKVRKTGFTIAPEAGSERMRRVINKGNKVDDLFRAVTYAFERGWDLLKLYYMVGLPFETEDDVKGIAHEANDCIKICKRYTPRAELKLGVSSFVPKPHTPFQWEPQMTIEETKAKYSLVKRTLSDRRVRVNHHHPEMSYIEGLFSRGDRRVARLIYLAFQEGCRFDEWEEHFDFSRWQKIFEAWDMDPAFYLHRRRDKDEVLPWDHLFAQMDKKFLWEEFEKAHDAAFTEDCSIHRCSDCGVCDFRVVKNRLFVPGDKEVMVKKGNREWYGWQRKEGAIVRQSDSAIENEEISGSPLPSHHRTNAPSHLSTRLRFRFSKLNLARFMGHLELMGVLKRAITRLKLPVSFSEGFHPQMKIAMGYPLSLGIESDFEYFDLDLYQPVELATLVERLNRVLPGGLEILSVELIDRQTPSLYSSTSQMSYTALIESSDPSWAEKATEALQRFNNEENFLWVRENSRGVKEFNLKELVTIAQESTPETLTFTTKINPDGSVKPQEVLKALFGMNQTEISRARLKKTGIVWKHLLPARKSSSESVQTGNA